jgi:hypothetical protein
MFSLFREDITRLREVLVARDKSLAAGNGLSKSLPSANWCNQALNKVPASDLWPLTSDLFY